jgi:arsenate reductase (glutaredoxin)
MAGTEQPDKASVFFNPACSKCRTVQGYLEEKGIEAEYVRYLDRPPTRAELEGLMTLLRIEDPTQMMRKGEPQWAELGLDDASREERLDAITQHPILLERPILVRGDRAVIARPAERALELLDG